jgi:hypothetical protein
MAKEEDSKVKEDHSSLAETENRRLIQEEHLQMEELSEDVEQADLHEEQISHSKLQRHIKKVHPRTDKGDKFSMLDSIGSLKFFK